MNKAIAILSVFATSAAFAAVTPTVVDSANQFSYVPLTNQVSGLKVVAVSVAGYSTGSEASIKIAEVLQVSSLSTNDKLYTLGSDGKYSEYILAEGGTWNPSRIVVIDADGSMKTVSGTPAEQATLLRGGAFWLDTAATSVYLMGQVPDGAVSGGVPVVGSGSATTFKFNLVGPSTSQGATLNSSFGASGDRVALADGTQYVRSGDVWKKIGKSGLKTTLTDADGTVIPAGVGFWYMAKGSNKTLAM